MMRSLYSAVSGLKTHQTKMDVIGNNVANVNTEAFKASSVRFSEIMYQTTSSATSGNGATGTGGVNAKQIGLGVSTASTTVSITSAGAAETTGNPFDLKLTDSQTTNFFVVSDGTNRFFTRAGSFYVDGNGYLCMSSTGYTLQGWQIDETTGEIKKDIVSPLQVMAPKNQTSAPEATTKAYASGVLDKNDSNVTSKTGYVMTLGFYDDLGYSYTAKYSYTPKYDANGDVIEGQYVMALMDIVDSESKSILKDENGDWLVYQVRKMINDPADPTRQIQEVDADGQAVFENAKGNPLLINELFGTDGTTFTDPTDNTVHYGYTVIFDKNKGTFVSVGEGEEVTTDVHGAADFSSDSVYLKMEKLLTKTIDPETGVAGSNFAHIEIDCSTMLNYNNNGTSTAKILKGDIVGDGTGKKLGALTGISVDADGCIYGSYDNGNTVLLCQIATAQFSNASGLEKVGNNCYKTTLNSGEFDGIGVEITADGSKISTGELEMSNVDLSGQFTDMIITQRGFQANSRVITTSDTLLEELINLKR